MNAADPKTSGRLGRVLRVLRSRRWTTTWDITVKAKTVAAHSCVAELRQHGYRIACRRHGSVWSYRMEGKR